MQNDEKIQEKEVFVTIILSESTTSLLKLSIPHLENVDPENSMVCVIKPGQQSSTQEHKVDPYGHEKPSTSKGDKPVEQLFSKISSDIGLFNIDNSSSTSFMYEDSQEDISEAINAAGSSGLEFKKIHYLRLVSARSMAHNNKLSMRNKEILVSLLDSESRSSADFICRICHGGESMDDLLATCRCRGTVALVHLKCLERWLHESNHSCCELCQHHYKIIREPRYSVLWSILVYLRNPEPNLKDILLDLVAFVLYTPSAIASTYMLMMICESLVKTNIITGGSFSAHLVAFSAIFGMAAIDFCYSSWLMATIQRNVEAWRDWYKSHSTLKVILPNVKMRPHKYRRILKPKE